jgi:hypothetical protein
LEISNTDLFFKIQPAPVQVQAPVVQHDQYNHYIQYNPIPVEITSAPIATSGKIKKDKKKQKKGNGDLDDDEIVRKSTCRCSIQ